MIRVVLLVLVLVWPALLGAALIDRFDDRRTLWGSVVYVAASRVCHQRADRSFHTHGEQWPVCARCAGLYLAAPFGAWLAPLGLGIARRVASWRAVALAAAPTAATWLFEISGAVGVSSVVRTLAAAPLGATVACAIVVAASPSGAIDRID